MSCCLHETRAIGFSDRQINTAPPMLVTTSCVVIALQLVHDVLLLSRLRLCRSFRQGRDDQVQRATRPRTTPRTWLSWNSLSPGVHSSVGGLPPVAAAAEPGDDGARLVNPRRRSMYCWFCNVLHTRSCWYVASTPPPPSHPLLSEREGKHTHPDSFSPVESRSDVYRASHVLTHQHVR